MLIRTYEPDFLFEDGRGRLVQLVHNGYRQINYIASHAGVVRGGHYHEHNRELFYVISGKFELTAWRVSLDGTGVGNDGEEKYVFGSGSMFEIPEYVAHSFKYIEETALISMYTEGVESSCGEKDIITAG